jgi:hypothetical protein
VTAPVCHLDRQPDTLRALDGDTLVLDSTRCALSDVWRLDVSRGRKSAWAAGLGIGVVAGALTGALLGAVSGNQEQGLFNGCLFLCSAGEKAAAGAAVLGGLGGLIGVVIGANTRKDMWWEVPLDRLRVSVVPTYRGVGLGASFTF